MKYLLADCEKREKNDE